jgi:uncharacterized protein YndB with AHSA1/START domain
MADYLFVTAWRFDAPVDRLWDAITRVDAWPQWWRGVESVVALQPGDSSGLGRVDRYTWKSRLPYRLTFDLKITQLERPLRFGGTATGELAGSALWELTPVSGTTRTQFTWRVETTKAWMNLLAPIARPLFAWNHDVIMEWGAEGLARHLSIRRLSL